MLEFINMESLVFAIQGSLVPHLGGEKISDIDANGHFHAGLVLRRYLGNYWLVIQESRLGGPSTGNRDTPELRIFRGFPS